MTPAELDLILNGAFIYQRANGERYASFDYKLKDYGIPLVGRTGVLFPEDLQCTQAELLERINQRLSAAPAQPRLSWLSRVLRFLASVAGAGTAKTAQPVEGEARQNGPQGDAQPTAQPSPPSD